MAGTGIVYPADAVAGAPQYAATQGRGAFAAAMAGATTARPLGGVTGVRPGTPTTTVTVTGTTWTAAPFGGYVDTHSSATNGGYFFAFNTTTSGSVTAAGGSARTDLVYVQPMDSNTSDGSTGAPRVVIDYISNYPTTALPARAFAIAQINVPASGGGSPTVTWLAPYTAAAGGVIKANTFVQLSAVPGTSGDRASVFADTNPGYNGDYRYSGTGWVLTGGTKRNYLLDLPDSGPSYSNTQTIATLALPALPHASRVHLNAGGVIGNAASASQGYGLNLVPSAGTLTDTQGNQQVAAASAAAWYPYTHGAYLDVPAATAVNVVVSFSTPGAVGHFKGLLRADVMFPGEY